MNPYNEQIDKVYFFTDGEFIKIGYTREKLYRRLKRLATGSPKSLYILGYVHGTLDDEEALHILFDKDRVRQDGEWFRPSDELIDYINAVNELQNKYVMINDDGTIMAYDCVRVVE